MELTLVKAAGCFSMAVPDYLEDTAVVGSICGVKIYAGDVRRLNNALVKDGKVLLDNEIEDLTREGKRIHAIKRCREVTGLPLREAKEYCDKIGLERGILVLKTAHYYPHSQIIGYPETEGGF